MAFQPPLVTWPLLSSFNVKRQDKFLWPPVSHCDKLLKEVSPVHTSKSLSINQGALILVAASQHRILIGKIKRTWNSKKEQHRKISNARTPLNVALGFVTLSATVVDLLDPNLVAWLHLHESLRWLNSTYLFPHHWLATSSYLPTTGCRGGKRTTSQSSCEHAQNVFQP